MIQPAMILLGRWSLFSAASLHPQAGGGNRNAGEGSGGEWGGGVCTARKAELLSATVLHPSSGQTPRWFPHVWRIRQFIQARCKTAP